MKVQLWPVDKPIPYAKNARKIGESAIAKVAASIKEFGWRQPIVVDTDGVIIAGHTRLLAAKKLGIDKVPVHVATDLTPAQVKAYRLMDNRSHEEAEWDYDLLNDELFDLKGLDLDLSLTGFDPDELAEVMAEKTAGLTDEDEVPEPPAEPVTQAGDLWLLGSHRLLCGDATESKHVERLMAGEKAGLMNTDPPYGIKYDSAELHEHGVSYAHIAGDHHENEALQAFLERAFSCALLSLKPNAAWYLWHAMLTQGFFAAAAAAAAAHVILHRQIIWVKPVLVFGRGHYHWKHELCFMGWVKGNEPPDLGDHTETTVWEVAGVTRSERRSFEHSTPKPVRLFEIPIVKHLKAGEICYEPFAGSGPQFVAAEKNARRCYGLEIDATYCDVIVQRWQNFSGKTATLDGDGRSFMEIAECRRPVAA